MNWVNVNFTFHIILPTWLLNGKKLELESSVIQLESSVIQLESSVIQLESSVIS